MLPATPEDILKRAVSAPSSFITWTWLSVMEKFLVFRVNYLKK
jgi:hypothetical protein